MPSLALSSFIASAVPSTTSAAATSGAPNNQTRKAVMDSAPSGLRPIPLARPPEFVVCPLMREIRAFRYFWPSIP
jgi:hypothetical protein